MIDYTQYAFAAPPQVVDPIPTVADYLDDYTARNEAWYQTFAAPLPGGGYGARQSSFERRAPFIPIPETPENPVPPILQDMPQYEGSEDNRTRPGDMPVGSLVRDVTTMTTPELAAEAEALTGTYGDVTPYIGTAVGAMGGGVPLLPALMAKEGNSLRYADLMAERMFRAPQVSALPSLFVASDAVIPDAGRQDVVTVPGGTQVFVAPDLFPEPSQSDSDRGYGGSRSGGRDTYQGGEVGAGGWAGGGGL